SRSSDPGLTGQAFNIGGLATGPRDSFPAVERRASGVPEVDGTVDLRCIIDAMEAGYGQRRINLAEQCFNSPCPTPKTHVSLQPAHQNAEPHEDTELDARH
ncbi:MAG TPA: hypothetical protein VJ255_13060, partial [Candidatus Acidoferrum sp.]|nr:hypothetical protein [Candidatus Acidoferrum sp.]